MNNRVAKNTFAFVRRMCGNIQPGFACLAIVIFVYGSAGTQTLTLHSQLDFPGTFHTDVWGYIDPNNNKEYAILGDASGIGLVIIDISDPDNPVQVAIESSVPGFDVKVWNHYVYTVNGGGSGNGGIVDITDPANPQVVGSFPSSHNIFISPAGYLFQESPGLVIRDCNNTPTNPATVWTGGFEGHDASAIGDRLYDFHGTAGTNIYNISNITNPQLLGVIQDPQISYHHSGYTSEDGRYLFICDELANGSQADITVWDIFDPSNPQKVDEFVDPNAIVHNLYIIGDFAYTSYYTAGLRVFDVSDPTNITLADEYDTSQLSGETFAGAFGVYPFSPNGLVLINDWQGGLFVFSFSGLVSTGGNPSADNMAGQFELLQNYPNPFNPSTSIGYRVPSSTLVNLTVYNVLGQPVRNLVNGVQSMGEYEIIWDGRNDSGQKLTSGVYLYKLQAGNYSKSMKMLMVE